jgi:formylglycine-generating enzyme required for sulfatase activity
VKVAATAIVLAFCAFACSKPSAPAVVETWDGGVAATSTAQASASAATVAPHPTWKTSPPGPMALIKGGSFIMGSDASAPSLAVRPDLANLMPAHRVILPSFRMDITEVTIAAYRSCVDAGACPAPAKSIGLGKPVPKYVETLYCPWDFPNVDDYPMSCVTWAEADAYCRWAGKSLPSEEMWEFAARGPVGRDFPWGWAVRGNDWGAPADIDDRVQANCPSQGGYRSELKDFQFWEGTCPVGRKPKGATPEGVLDMEGNVYEWTSSKACPYSTPNCETESYSARSCAEKVAQWMNAVSRSPRHRLTVDARLGFRCAQVLDREPVER